MIRKGDKIGMGYMKHGLQTDLSTLTPPTQSQNPYIVTFTITICQHL